MRSFFYYFRLFSALAAAFLLLAGSVAAQEIDSVKKEVYVLKGKVTDAETGEAIPFANVILYQDGEKIGGTISDFDGNYRIGVNRERQNCIRTELKASSIGFYSKAHIYSFLPLDSTIINLKLDELPREVVQLPKYGSDKEIFNYPEPGTRTYTREDFRRRFR